MKKKKLTLTLPLEVKEMVREQAKARGISMSALGREVLMKIIERASAEEKI